MGKPKKRSQAGIGECGNPACDKPKAPNRFTCEEHGAELDRIRKEMADDPLLIYNMRSDSQNRKMLPAKRNTKRRVCRVIGCYEIRVPPNAFCFAHQADHTQEED